MRREALVLIPPIQPRELVRPAGDTSQAVRDAMNAALAGDFEALDALELTYLNVLARIGELVLRHPDGALHSWCQPYLRGDLEGVRAPFVTAYCRGFYPAGRSALEWQLRTKCRRCAGLLRRLECRVCGGCWYVDDFADHEVLYTDVDGVLLEEWA